MNADVLHDYNRIDDQWDGSRRSCFSTGAITRELTQESG